MYPSSIGADVPLCAACNAPPHLSFFRVLVQSGRRIAITRASPIFGLVVCSIGGVRLWSFMPWPFAQRIPVHNDLPGIACPVQTFSLLFLAANLCWGLRCRRSVVFRYIFGV